MDLVYAPFYLKWINWGGNSMNKRLLIVIPGLIGLLLVAMNAWAGGITVKHAPKRFSDIGLETVSSEKNGVELSREFKLKLRNAESRPVHNLKATLIHTSDQVTVEKGEVRMDQLSAREMAESQDTVRYRVDTNKTRLIPEIKLHWVIEYEDDNGEHHVDEMLITERVRTP
jgi:hypothetical protein